MPTEPIPACHWTSDSLRHDFHAFGVTRALLEHGLREGGHDTTELANANAPLLAAARAAVSGDADRGREKLQEAFCILADIRCARYPFERGWIDIPHAGILAADGGIAELEWPQLTCDYLAQMADLAETRGYRFALEYNTGSWVETARRHPATVERLARLWRAGQIEIVNGTWSGPLQQYSNIELAAREFEIGQAANVKLFGKPCETYACQELSFMPSFPGLLRDFGYKRAIHTSQNRGQAPASRHNHFLWQGKDGRSIAAVGHHEFDLVQRNVNFYLEWPTMFIGCLKEGLNSLDSACMHDQGLVIFREEMVRSETYAPVLGQHRTPKDVLPEGCEINLQKESFQFDRYTFEAACHGPICDHWISVFEEILRYSHWIVRVEALASAAFLEEVSELNPVWEWILYLESHDNVLVPGGTSGDFYYYAVMEFAGAHFGFERLSFGRLLSDRRPKMEAVLSHVEDTALARLGLCHALGHTTCTWQLRNPHPQTLVYGGWFPWSGEDLQAYGKGVRLRTWHGRAYWSGRLDAGLNLALTVSPAESLCDTHQLTDSRFEWILRHGLESTLVVVPQKGDQPHILIEPVDASGEPFRLHQLRHSADDALAVTHVEWTRREMSGGDLNIVIDFVQIFGSPLLSLHAEVTGFNPSGSHKENDALRLRFKPDSELKAVEFFVSHFTEESRKDIQTSSPYLAKMVTANGHLSIFNRGSIWHTRHRDALEVVLMVPHEKVSRRDFAIAWNIEHPVTTAIRQLDHPILTLDSEIGGSPRRHLTCGQANLWLSSWRPDGQVRISETEGLDTEATIMLNPGASEAHFLGERGMLGEQPRLDADGNVCFRIAPYESLAVQIIFNSIHES
jgi:hypothetical protein